MEQIRLDLIPNGIMPNVHASQFDKSRTVRFNLYEGDTPFTLLATDNVKVACNGVDDTTLATAGTSHDWTIPDSVVADSGVFIGELSVERGPKTIGSKNFVLNVEEDAYNGKNIEERTASGSIANFETNLQDNLTACKCEINPLQSGTGTPAPSNPRPISGFSALNVTLADENMQTVDTASVNFGQTVYGGVLDVTNGKLTITHKGETFTSVVNGGASSSTSWWGQLLSSGAKPTNNNIKADVKASYLETVTASQVISVENNSIGVNTNGAINIKIQGMTSLADYNTYLANNPLTVVYELATPTEITLTPKQIEAIVGINNVFHDCNGEIEVKYLVEV